MCKVISFSVFKRLTPRERREYFANQDKVEVAEEIELQVERNKQEGYSFAEEMERNAAKHLKLEQERREANERLKRSLKLKSK